MENTPKDYSHIKGWGVDIDPKNDPTYPMKHRTDAEQKGYSWPRPPQQPVDIEVLHSNERPNVSAVFGMSAPPTGLSGMIRRFAFRYGEGSFGHWLPLLLADRVNVVEGVVDDLLHGHIPNILAEKGLKAEWQHNPKRSLRRIAIAAAVTGAVVFWVKNRRND